MNPRTAVFCWPAFFQWVGLSLLATLLTNPVQAQSSGVTITVCTQTGSVLHVEVDRDSFQFGEPRSNGKIVIREVRFDEIRELRLTPEPIGGQASRVTRLIADLGHPDYRIREEAERLLSEPKIGGRFEELIRKARDTGSMEVRYRIKRILQNLVEHVNLEPAKMDRLLLKDGQQISGDATRLEISGKVRGLPVHLSRGQLRHVYGPGEFAKHLPKRTGSRLHSAKVVLEPDAPFYKNGDDTVLDFEMDPYGSSVALNDRMNDMFVAQGLRLSSTSPRYIRSIRFSFKLCPLGEGIKAICVHDPESNRTFRGMTLIDFCVPGQPDVAAGVHRFGVFVERVDHSRDFVAEALDPFGNVVGYSEATDQGCWFIGFESQVPIARVRILQNPYLPNSSRTLDEMYALDNLTFDTPVLLEPAPRGYPHTAQLHFDDDNILAVRQMKLGEKSVSAIADDLKRPVSFDSEQLRSVLFDRRPKSPPAAHWFVMLEDGSIVLCRYQNGFHMVDWNDQGVSLDEILGFWPSDQPGRFAPPSDFESGKPVVVFPGCRILADDLVLAGDTVEWDPESAERMGKVILAGNEQESDLDDPCPHVSLIRLDDPQPAATIWLKSPEVDPDHPQIVSIDGRRWMTGQGGRFAIETLQDRSITVQFHDIDRKVPLDDLRYIRMK